MGEVWGSPAGIAGSVSADVRPLLSSKLSGAGEEMGERGGDGGGGEEAPKGREVWNF